MVMTDSHEALAFLLSQGSDMNTRLFDGKTFWHIAAQHSDLRTIKILLNADLRGLDPEAVDNAGFRPAEYLSQRKDEAEVSDPFRALMLEVENRAVGKLLTDSSRQLVDLRSILMGKNPWWNHSMMQLNSRISTGGKEAGA